RCPGCRGGHGLPGAPAPALPGGQDGPSGGGSGSGHPIGLADLWTAPYPVAPVAVNPRTLHRTAPADQAAPGGPAVVPD
ncbi:hypothetical protein, partial [Actinomadura fibrosa]